MSNLRITLTLAVLMTCSIGFSQVSSQLNALVGEKATYLDSDMQKNGFSHIKTTKSGFDAYSYYWNYNTKKCVTTRTNDGRVASITSTMPFDCNKGGSNNNDSYYHAAHHHSNGTHYTSESTEQAYERGHNDGLHNSSYHNIYSDNDHSKAYAEGYTSGVEQRKNNTYHHSTRGGYHAHVQVNDLMGWAAKSAYDELKSRGFSEEKSHSNDGTTYRVWYNNDTNQCIKTTSKNENITLVQVSTHCGRG